MSLFDYRAHALGSYDCEMSLDFREIRILGLNKSAHAQSSSARLRALPCCMAFARGVTTISRVVSRVEFYSAVES